MAVLWLLASPLGWEHPERSELWKSLEPCYQTWTLLLEFGAPTAYETAGHEEREMRNRRIKQKCREQVVKEQERTEWMKEDRIKIRLARRRQLMSYAKKCCCFFLLGVGIPIPGHLKKAPALYIIYRATIYHNQRRQGPPKCRTSEKKSRTW